MDWHFCSAQDQSGKQETLVLHLNINFMIVPLFRTANHLFHDHPHFFKIKLSGEKKPNLVEGSLQLILPLPVLSNKQKKRQITITVMPLTPDIQYTST